ncbi:PH domain-containing protein [Ornithinibacillus sp. L9]|uniref:PH domain-containing protein n=1 Tax=Ornithinibacillus caprae TaxID=2678566 RepID=A0A6N8FK04_9BACI|nr:PH domain-containing protein [Ornithinibacillus caprae]MUK89723.1 PH domain-containing protein [Ornithinibacillus caprae]
MRQPPSNTIAKDAIKAWRITALLGEGIVWLVTISLGVLYFVFDWSVWIVLIAFIVSVLSTVFFVVILPKLRWRRWRYEVFEQEIYIQHGILIVSRTLVPMIRVQHVDTKQGPILKRYNLASVTISTAATTHEIPALLEEDASELRDRISALARVDEDDV